MEKLSPLLRARTSMRMFRKPDVHIYLLKDVPSIGKKNEILLVPSEAARQYFIPFKLAYYVPRDHGKPVLPDGWEPKVSKLDMKLEQILPAFLDAPITESDAPDAVDTIAPVEEPSRSSDAEQSAWKVIKSLKLDEGLTLERSGIPGENKEGRIFGSVSPEDVMHQLLFISQNESRASRELLSCLNPQMFSFADAAGILDGRIKSAGRFTATVNLGSLEPIAIPVNVVALKKLEFL